MSHRPRPSIKTFTTVCFVFASTIYVSGDDLQKNIPESESLLIAQSKDLRLDKHDLDGAEKILQQVLAKFPNYYKAHYNLGLVYQDKGNYDAAIQELEKARTIRERQKLSEFSIYNTLGWAYMLKGATKKAEESYLTGVKYETQNTPESNRRLYNNLAWFYYGLGKADEAKKYIDMAEQKYQSEPAAELRKLIEQLAVDKQKIDEKSAVSLDSPSPTPHK